MLEVCLLGTGGMMPLPYRWLTSMMARYNGKSILIDCGEGTQIALKEKGWSPKPIDIICFTHFHADHISGLPGLLLTMGNAERTEPLLIIGPKGLTRTVNALRIIAPELPFPIQCAEISEPEQTFSFDGFRIEAFRVNHNVTCYGYSIAVERAGRFQLDKAEALGIEKHYWNRLQKGETLEIDGRLYTPDMVMGEARRGLKVTYCTDTRAMRTDQNFLFCRSLSSKSLRRSPCSDLPPDRGKTPRARTCSSARACTGSRRKRRRPGNTST